MYVHRSYEVAWEDRSEGETTRPTTRDTPTAADSDSIDDQERSEPPILSDEDEETLSRLEDWIDCPSIFRQKENTSPVYLYKAEFSFEILMEGLVYVVSKYKTLIFEYHYLASIATRQYDQDISGWMAQYGIGSEYGMGEMKNVSLEEEIKREDWKTELRNVLPNYEESRFLRRTILAMIRLVEKFKACNYDMRVGIAVLQGDVEPESEN